MQEPTTVTYHNSLFTDLIYPPPLMMWPPGRFQPWGLIAFQPYIIFKKNNTFSGPSHFHIHQNNLNKLTWHVSSQALLIIHVCHTTWSLRQICILKKICPHDKHLVSYALSISSLVLINGLIISWVNVIFICWFPKRTPKYDGVSWVSCHLL